MTKQEYKRLKEIWQDFKDVCSECGNECGECELYRVRENLAEFLRNAKQLDEPKECVFTKEFEITQGHIGIECKSCNTIFSTRGTSVSNFVTLSCVPNETINDWNYCPNCGAKIKGGVK